MSEVRPQVNQEDLGEMVADVHAYLVRRGWPERTRLILVARDPDNDDLTVLLTDEPTHDDVRAAVEAALKGT